MPTGGKIKHGHCRGGKSREYRTWQHMLWRCMNPKCPRYPCYGGRGIKICERWMKFDNFLADMGRKPVGLTIDRIDVNGNYEPSNCRWATWHEQSINSRKSLTDAEVAEIKVWLSDGFGPTKLARLYDVSRSLLNQIKAGTARAYVAPSVAWGQ